MPTAYFLNKVYTRRPFVSAAKFIEFNFNKWTRYIYRALWPVYILYIWTLVCYIYILYILVMLDLKSWTRCDDFYCFLNAFLSFVRYRIATIATGLPQPAPRAELLPCQRICPIDWPTSGGHKVLIRSLKPLWSSPASYHFSKFK